MAPLLAAAAAAVALAAPPAFGAPSGAPSGAPATGRQLVLLEDARGARASALAGALASRAGARVAGRGVPRLGIATVRGSPAALAALRRDPAVAQVVPERRRELRRLPNDPALGMPETAPGTPPGTAVQWALARQGFPEAWDVTTAGGAIVGVIDTGLDGSHPELGPKVAAAFSFGTSTGALSDDDGHGSHVGGLACAATDNGLGVAGAGWHCRLAVVKAPNLADEDVVNGIVAATDAGAEAINMSFGGGPPSAAIDRAIDYAFARDVVLVAAASNEADRDQGARARSSSRTTRRTSARAAGSSSPAPTSSTATRPRASGARSRSPPTASSSPTPARRGSSPPTRRR